MSSRRRSERRQMQDAIEASKRENEEADSSNNDESNVNDDKEPSKRRLRKKGDSTGSRKRPRESAVEEKEGDDLIDSDGLGDPDFADSDDEDEATNTLSKQERDGSVSSEQAGRRLRKKSESLKRKRPTIHDDSDEKSNDDDRSASASQSSRAQSKEDFASKEPSIPKKGTIPKKKSSNEPTSSTSLLAHMKPAHPPPLPPAAASAKPQSPPMISSASRKPRPDNIASPPRAKSDRSPPRFNKPEGTKTDPVTLSSSPAAAPPLIGRTIAMPAAGGAGGYPVQKRNKELALMSGLQELCGRVKQSGKFANDRSGGLDLSGSFLPDDTSRYDFFDKNERGEIVLQPKIPIFPEEFPPGMKEHTLSWWGILDPALGDGKYRPAPTITDPRTRASLPPQEQQPRSRSRSGPPGMAEPPPPPQVERLAAAPPPPQGGWNRDRDWRSGGPPPDWRGPPPPPNASSRRDRPHGGRDDYARRDRYSPPRGGRR